MKLTLTNDFHNTSVCLNVKDNKITAGQVKRAQKELCGIATCACSNELGTRGPQFDSDGNRIGFAPVYVGPGKDYFEIKPYWFND